MPRARPDPVSSSASQATLDLQSTAEFDPDEGVRREAGEALRRIRGQSEGAEVTVKE